MIALVLLSVYWLETRRALWMTGAAMGMALSIKIVPVIFIPAVLLYLPGMRQRWRYLATVAAVFGLASLPYLVQRSDPDRQDLAELQQYARFMGIFRAVGVLSG